MKSSNRHLKARLALMVAVVMVMTLAATTAVQAGVFDTIIAGFKTTGENAGYPAGTNEGTFVKAWVTYVNRFATIMGLFFMILVIYGGWLWMTARGNDEQVAKAKNRIVHASIGLGIVIGSYIVFQAVIMLLGSTISATTSDCTLTEDCPGIEN